MQVEFGKYLRPFEGEIHSGDECLIYQVGYSIVAVMIDVLGHGEEAYGEAQFMKSELEAHMHIDPAFLMEALNEACTGRRGAAVGVISFDLRSGDGRYIGIGNTSFKLIGEEYLHPVSKDGIVGNWKRGYEATKLRISPGDTILMYSDGLKSNFDTDLLEKNTLFSADQFARYFVDSFGKSTDDASCMVLRIRND